VRISGACVLSPGSQRRAAHACDNWAGEVPNGAGHALTEVGECRSRRLWAPTVPTARRLEVRDQDVSDGQRLIVRTDGASRGNPGHAAAGVVIERADGSVKARGKRYLGVMTNNQAEYRALILGLRAVARYAPSAVSVYLDSELVVKQMLGQYQVRDEYLRPLYDEARALARALPRVSFTHVPRGKNALADQLANEALDERALDERARM